MIPQSFIQDLLARIDIVDVIERHLTLKKSGANYFARCPFHGEKSASFSVSPSKQFYHCFGCGVHGNAIGFLMEYSGLSFIEAVRELAQQAGLKLPESQPGSGSDTAPRITSASEGLHEVMAAAAHHYREQLKNTPEAIAYLKRRGLSGEIAARFGIGYAPDDWQGLRKIFPSYEDKQLVDAGLVIVAEDSGRRYDRFRKRIMFPIQDRRGRIIAFGGRVLDSGEPKYLNSPETPLFEKGRELYGITQAQKAIRDEGHALVVEGYMDVVTLAQFGVCNAVATLGTATTQHHLQTLMRFTDRIVFSFDGDAAGRKAARRALEASLETLRDDVTLAFLFLPAEHDPDSFVRAHGAQALREAATHATPLTRFLLDTLSDECDLGTAEGRARLVHEARPLVTRVAAPLLRLQLIKAVAEAGMLNQGEVEQAYGLKPSQPPRQSSTSHGGRFGTPRIPRATTGPRTRPGSAVSLLLRLVLQHPIHATRLPVDLIPADDTDGTALIAIIDAISIGDLDPGCNLATLVEHFRETPHASTLSKAAAELVGAGFEDEVIEDLFDDTLRKLQADAIEREISSLTRQARERGLSSAERYRLADLLIRKRQPPSLCKH